MRLDPSDKGTTLPDLNRYQTRTPAGFHGTQPEHPTMQRKTLTAGEAAVQLHQARDAVLYLTSALKCAKRAKADRTAARIRLALSSAKGAVRAAEGREARARAAASRQT